MEAKRREQQSAQRRQQKASPFRNAAAAPRPPKGAEERRARLVEALDGFLREPQAPPRLYALFVAHFEWRRTIRLAFGAARREGDEARCRALRERERCDLRQFAQALAEPLSALQAELSREADASKAIRELRRDLRIGARSDSGRVHLRLGTLRRDRSKGGRVWTIEPHAPGLTQPSFKPSAKAPYWVGLAVLYEERGTSGKASRIEPLSRDDARRREPSGKVPGTAGKRAASGSVRTVVSGGGGPGTGKRK